MHADALAEGTPPQGQATLAKPEPQVKMTGPVSLQECIDIALQNNRYRPVSKFAVEIAEAQYRQALSSYWPQLSVKAVYSVMDEDPNFIFSFNPAQSFIHGGSGFCANFFTKHQAHGQREPQLPLNMTYLPTPGACVKLEYQAEQGLQAAKQEARRTDIQVVYDVRRMYMGLFFLGKTPSDWKGCPCPHGSDLSYGESYKRGSDRVRKTDYFETRQ